MSATVGVATSPAANAMSVAPAFDGHPVSWRAYFIRRFFRIAPLYYVVIAYAVYFGPDRPDYPVTLFLHLSFANMFFPPFANDILSIEWAVAVEWGFYVIFPMLAILARSPAGLAAVPLDRRSWIPHARRAERRDPAAGADDVRRPLPSFQSG